MINLFSNLFARAEPVLSEAASRDAAAIAALHAASFRRGWSEQEVEGLLTDRASDRASRAYWRETHRLHHVAAGGG